MPLRTNDSAIRILLPQPVEAHKVLDDRNSTQQRRADTEDGIGRQLVARKTVPHAKVHADGHEDAVDEDERPKPDDGISARSQRVLERRRFAEVRVVVRDLSVWVDCMWVWRYCAADVCAGDGGCCCASWLAFVVVNTRSVDLHDGHGEGVGIASCVCGCGSFRFGYGLRDWPQRLCRRLLGGHGGVA